MSALEINDVAAAYGRARVLESASLRVEPGEVVGLVGRNGAGKTTLLRVVSGMVGMTRGTINLGGRSLPRVPAAVARRGVVHVPEGRGLFPSLTVRENLRVGASIRRRLDASIVDRVTELVPRIAPVLDRRAGSLSGGEQQLVAIGRGLAADPSHLLVDEASLGLSPRAAEEVYSLVRHVASGGIGCLLVDQNISAVQDCSSRTYVLSGGSTRLVGTETIDVAELYD
jgi:branched-chain amino acid transport system ATP-binding protein